MAEPVVMYGIGATKAGTSWLYRYLAAHPDCYLRSIKELHFFDAREQDSRDWYLKQLKNAGASLGRRIASGQGGENGQASLHLAEIGIYSNILRKGDETAYLAFLQDGREDERVVGDITPSYSLLSAECLAHMAKIAGDARFVYLMRDPVDRLWSHVRMIARRRSKDGSDIPERAARIFDKTLDGQEEHIVERGDYRATLEKLEMTLDPDRVFLCTYEELFSDAALDRLCEFLGIRPMPGDYDTCVHTGIPVPMTADQKQRAAKFLRPQYDYVASKLGQMPRGWGAAMAGA
ncbi:MAG: sulfotransferase [Albidovulum sp.]|uniref:sulfotransferase family protein n=1 Tax=Albidovulum sp. TaxID=1872424 RepID=UPI003CBB79B3